MSHREWRERIQDILDAIAEIQRFTDGMDFKTFANDAKTIRAVEMNFIVIGEAANQIPDDIADDNPGVQWHLMRAMRNRLVHAYFQVDEKLMWDTVKKDLPTLIPKLEKLK